MAVFWNVGFLVTGGCDSVCVFAKQYFEFSETQFRELRRPVIFDATATGDVRDIILDGSLCRIALSYHIVKQIQQKYSPLAIAQL